MVVGRRMCALFIGWMVLFVSELMETVSIDTKIAEVFMSRCWSRLRCTLSAAVKSAVVSFV
jgi:hypothetical protein